jgi:hypothetical protein
MSEIERDPAAVREYDRTVREVAGHRAVDEAEDAVARSWIAELDEMRREALRLAMTVRMAERLALGSLREAQARGRMRELAMAHARFARTESAKDVGLEHAYSLLTSVDVELEAVCQAGLERSRREREDLRRLRAAWTAAYGTDDGDKPGG